MITHTFSRDDWEKKASGEWSLHQVVDENGERGFGIGMIRCDDLERAAPITERRMNVVELDDGTRQTIATLTASEPFSGEMDVMEGPPVPEGFIPLKITGVAK